MEKVAKFQPDMVKIRFAVRFVANLSRLLTHDTVLQRQIANFQDWRKPSSLGGRRPTKCLR
ncbi:hypothetical protein MESS4_220021 [Mesorhizobium sp. STM 4661]|nr:hypothetical protein MESS4_220021 [Mesorhizobium sp. STM 4661]